MLKILFFVFLKKNKDKLNINIKKFRYIVLTKGSIFVKHFLSNTCIKEANITERILYNNHKINHHIYFLYCLNIYTKKETIILIVSLLFYSVSCSASIGTIVGVFLSISCSILILSSSFVKAIL